MSVLRRSIGLVEQECTSCLICVRECPCQCIDIERHTEQVSEGRRPRTVHVLDAFAIDFALCMFCGICVDACPTDALLWSETTGLAAQQRDQLVSGRADLALRAGD
ncbi:MAG: 4Fe-4S binding protein [Candidatus Nanopelagicales bacterium]|nr:4Fe-4S binding protein [Candidatus Nanopelagicales bacterium]